MMYIKITFHLLSFQQGLRFNLPFKEDARHHRSATWLLLPSLGKGRMRMNDVSQLLHRNLHLHGKHGFRNQFRSMRSDNMDSQNLPILLPATILIIPSVSSVNAALPTHGKENDSPAPLLFGSLPPSLLNQHMQPQVMYKYTVAQPDKKLWTDIPTHYGQHILLQHGYMGQHNPTYYISAA